MPRHTGPAYLTTDMHRQLLNLNAARRLAIRDSACGALPKAGAAAFADCPVWKKLHAFARAD